MASNINKKALKQLDKKIEKAINELKKVSSDPEVTQREMWVKWSEDGEKLMEALKSEVNRII